MGAAVYLYVASNGPLENGHPSGWFILFFYYLVGASGAAGGLLGLVFAARLEPRPGWGLALAQGLIATLAPLLVPAAELMFISRIAGIAVCALVGSAGALLSLGIYIARRTMVEAGDPSSTGHRGG